MTASARSLCARAACVGVFALALAAPVPAPASVQVKNGLIAYWDADVKQIFTRALDGSDVRQLTSPPGQAAQAAFSPDGQAIAYSDTRGGDAGIWTMNADGSEKKELGTTGTAQDPAWSLDGSQIAYDRYAGTGNAEVWIMDSDGSGQRPVLQDANRQLFEPTLSPDGSQLAAGYSATKSGTSRYGILTADLNGGSETELTSNEWQNGQSNSAPITDEMPVYSPDGRQVAFQRCGFTGFGMSCSVLTMDADGSDLGVLTNKSLNAENPVWSPNGQQIIFDAYLGPFAMGPPPPGPFLYVVNADGSSSSQLKKSKGAGSPSWQSVIRVRGSCRGNGHVVVGTYGPNILDGSGRRDMIDAGAGPDRVLAKGGKDTVCGGPGADRIVGGAGADRIVGGPGRDVLIGGPGKDRIISGPGDVVRP